MSLRLRRRKAAWLLSLYACKALLALSPLLCGPTYAYARPLKNDSGPDLASSVVEKRSVDGAGNFGQYIVVLNDGVDMSAHLQWLADAMAANGGPPTPPDRYPGGKDAPPPAPAPAPSPATPGPAPSPESPKPPSPAPPADGSSPASPPPSDKPPSPPPSDKPPSDSAPASPPPSDGSTPPTSPDTPANPPSDGSAPAPAPPSDSAPADGTSPPPSPAASPPPDSTSGASPPSAADSPASGSSPGSASPPASGGPPPNAPPPGGTNPTSNAAPLNNNAPTYGNAEYNNPASPFYQQSGPYDPAYGNAAYGDPSSDDYLVPGPLYPGYGNPDYSVPGSPGYAMPAFPTGQDGSDVPDDPYDDPGMPGYRKPHPKYDGPTGTNDGATSAVQAAYGSLGIYTGTFTGVILQAIKDNPSVQAVTPDDDMFVAVQAASQTKAPWNLARIASRAVLPKTIPAFRYNATSGRGVDIYILDTGCYADHRDIRGRVVSQQAFPRGPTSDGNGHGTHVAATAAGTWYGVAKNARIVCIKVFSDGGAGSVSNLIAGVHYAMKRKKKRKTPGVLVISANGPPNAGLDAALRGAIKKGLHVVVAAGNGAADSANSSPAREPSIISVGAIDIKDAVAPFSNTGPLITLFAPGVNIESAWISNSGGSAVLSGTSMAAPLVAGTLASHISVHGNAHPHVWRDRLLNSSSIDNITGLGSETPNRLLYNAWNNATDLNTTYCWSSWQAINVTNWNSTCNTTEMRPKGRFKAYRRRDTFAMPFDSYDDLFPYTSPKRPRSHHHSHSQHLGSRWQFWR